MGNHSSPIPSSGARKLPSRTSSLLRFCRATCSIALGKRPGCPRWRLQIERERTGQKGHQAWSLDWGWWAEADNAAVHPSPRLPLRPRTPPSTYSVATGPARAFPALRRRAKEDDALRARGKFLLLHSTHACTGAWPGSCSAYVRLPFFLWSIPLQNPTSEVDKRREGAPQS